MTYSLEVTLADGKVCIIAQAYTRAELEAHRDRFKLEGTRIINETIRMLHPNFYKLGGAL